MRQGRLSGIIAQADVATRVNKDSEDRRAGRSHLRVRDERAIEAAVRCRRCVLLACGAVGYSRSAWHSSSQPTIARPGLVDVLDRVLDKGLVIAGDIKVSLAEVELLTIRIRLLVCSLDKAQEIGLDWWRYDRDLSPGAPAARRSSAPRSCRRRCGSSSARWKR